MILRARGHAQYRGNVRTVDQDKVQVGGLQLLQQPREGVDTPEVPEVGRPQLGHQEHILALEVEAAKRLVKSPGYWLVIIVEVGRV